MKRILIFGMTDNPGGMEACIMNYYRNFDQKKLKIDFLCNFYPMVYEEEVKQAGSKVFYIPKRSENYKLYKIEITKFFKEHSNDYDIFWFHTCSLANIDYLRLSKKHGIKKRIVHAHNSKNMDSKARGVLHEFNKMIVHKYATNLYACSDEAALFFYTKKIMDTKNYNIINNAIDIEDFKFDLSIRNEVRKEFKIETKIVIGNVGRFHFQKNHIFLIDIFKEIYKLNSNTVLLLVGQGEEYPKIYQKVKKYNLEHNVFFLGVRSDVHRIMQAMDIFLFPSLFEGLGVVLIEAQASGLPCFTSKNVVPKTAQVSDLLEYIDLSMSSKEWAEKIVNAYDKNLDRSLYSRKLDKKGYNIHLEAKKLEETL